MIVTNKVKRTCLKSNKTQLDASGNPFVNQNLVKFHQFKANEGFPETSLRFTIFSTSS